MQILAGFYFCQYYLPFRVQIRYFRFVIWILLRYFEGTLIQFWKSLYMSVFIEKYCPENFIFLILEIAELLNRKVCIFGKQ